KSIPGTINIPLAIAETQTKTGRNVLWVGSTQGLLKIDLPRVDSLVKDSKYFVSVVTDILKTAPFVSQNPSLSHSFQGSYISSIYKDTQDILWIGSEAGVNAYLSKNDLFKSFPIPKGMVTSIRIDSFAKKYQYLITAWYGNGLTITDTNGLPIKIFNRVPRNSKFQNNGQISDIVRTDDGKLWIGTFNGLYCYDERSGKYTSYLHHNGDFNSLASNHIIALAKDNEGHLWISLYRDGADELDCNTGELNHYRHKENDTNSLSNNQVWRIEAMGNGNIAFCTGNGLSIYNKKSKGFTNYMETTKLNSLKGTIVSGVVKDHNGIMWISTNKGLNRYNSKTGSFSLYANEEGLKDENILGMAEDQNHQLWLISQNSVALFNPEKATFVNYDEQCGLTNKELTGPIVADGQGNMLVGGKDFLLKFTPKDFKFSPANTRVFITQLWISGQEWHFNKPIGQTGEIILNYPQNNFSCSFDAPEFFEGTSVKYSYRLEGAEDKWIYADTRNFVSYANLSPGTYLFQVRAMGADGQWTSDNKGLYLKVRPAFWDTWWFRIMVLLLVALLVYGLFVYRMNNIRRTEKLKTKLNSQLADMRLKAMRSRMNPHFLFNALNSIQELIYTNNTDSAYKYLSKFSKLVRMILERSEQQFITISQEIEMLRLYLDLEALRFQESFTYTITHNELAIDFLDIPPMLVQPFVENAIWHGLAHKKEEKILQVIFKADDRYIYVIVEDNGIGRTAAQAFKPSLSEKRQSLGIKLVAEQLDTVGKLAGREASIQTEDLFHEDETGQKVAVGTRVTLKIPILSIK
ncbi:MAG: histidine kinase, partial [Chitinophagaceae bacterium]